ncbi:MAG: flavin reductase [Lachnospiraceae bacterium]|nr:flavin reductase [Lachnospiraceae bacterium]
MFKIGYGLYVVTSHDGQKDNGCIVNTVVQLTSSPNRVAVCINKQNYTHHIVEQTGKLNLNCLSVEAPFSVFQEFGFVSGRAADKFAGKKVNRSDNGLVYLDQYINAYLSLRVEEHKDMGTHGLFICSVTESKVISQAESMTYSYYQSNVKPRPPKAGEGEAKKKGWVCSVCGYVYEGEDLPEDFICPLCKHGASDFEKLQ